MLLHIPDMLAPDEVAAFRRQLDRAEWVDGNATAGHRAVLAKHNEQVSQSSPIGRKLGETLREVLLAHPLFVSAALPHSVFPPLFNRYAGGQRYGDHVDSAVRRLPGETRQLRTDLSATLFLSDPADYDGGELVVEQPGGLQSVKLPAGHLALYPARSVHRVEPVTRGVRVGAFFWVQSLVRDDGARALMFDLDRAIQRATVALGAESPILVELTNVYHNLLRHWAET